MREREAARLAAEHDAKNKNVDAADAELPDGSWSAPRQPSEVDTHLS
jgi:hypothetical protein